MRKYMISKKECESRLDGRVCSQCGGKLEPIETVDNAGNPTYWSGCKYCRRFDWGVTSDVWEAARMMVNDYHFIAYKYLDFPDGTDKQYQEYWRKIQIGGTTDIVAEVIQCLEKVRAKSKRQNKFMLKQYNALLKQKR